MAIAIDRRIRMFNSSVKVMSSMSKRRVLEALLLLVSSSCSGPLGLWQSQSCAGSAPEFSSERIFLCPANEFSGLELEFVRTLDGLRLFLNVYGLQIPSEQPEGSTSRVFISFKDHSYCFSAIRFSGGQRLLIPAHVLDEIVEYLQEDQSVFIQVDRYQADIYPGKFLPLFTRMVSKPF